MDKKELKKKLAEGYKLTNVDLYGEPVPVLYKTNWLREGDVTHIEFHSHLTSPTGYHSYFAWPSEIEAEGGLEKYLGALAIELHHARNRKGKGRRQATLF